MTVIALRFFKSKTASGVLVPDPTKAKIARLVMPKMPALDSESTHMDEEEKSSSQLLLPTRDIFRPTKTPPVEKRKPESTDSDERKSTADFQLKGTITGGSESLAIVNDRFLRRGDVIQDYTVARIDEDNVVLKSGEHEIHLEVLKVVDPRMR
jgi:hypothetical protein